MSGRKRNVQIKFRASEEEAEKLQKKVEQSGMSSGAVHHEHRRNKGDCTRTQKSG